MSRSKSVGTTTETAVVKAFQIGGFPRARRYALRGARDVGDVDTGDDNLVIEVKGGTAAETASDTQVGEWLAETERERRNADAALGILVLKRKGIGLARAGEWWAVLPGIAFVALVFDAPTAAHTVPNVAPYPVRVHLQNVIDLLRMSGYGGGGFDIDPDVT